MTKTPRLRSTLSRRAFFVRSGGAAAGAAAAALAGQALAAPKHTLVYAKDGSGVFGYKDTPVQPWSGFHVHDPDRPAPRKVEPGLPGREDQAGTPPSDAVVLFDGGHLDAWKPADWKIEDGAAVAMAKPLVSKESFGDCQIHLEWATPNPPEGSLMNRGNNGVYIMGLYEVQIFESYAEKIYPDGQAAAVYGQTPPLVNACRKPGQWQLFDIVFLAPRFEGDELKGPARLTVLHNGILVHHNQEVHGRTMHSKLPDYDNRATEGPLVLGAHRNPVRFRNIWVRRL